MFIITLLKYYSPEYTWQNVHLRLFCLVNSLYSVIHKTQKSEMKILSCVFIDEWYFIRWLLTRFVFETKMRVDFDPSRPKCMIHAVFSELWSAMLGYAYFKRGYSNFYENSKSSLWHKRLWPWEIFLKFSLRKYNVNKVQVNNYEIVVKFFHISHKLTWYSAIVHEFTRIYQVCSTYDLTKQFM